MCGLYTGVPEGMASYSSITFLLFAAHDTTTSALCSALFALADNPDWQERLVAEVDAIPF